jgi:hypothetical protein
VERQGDGVVDHDVGRQVALALARLAGLDQDPPHPVGRERPGDHAEADMIAEADAGRQAGRNTGHRCRPPEKPTGTIGFPPLTEQHCH